MMRNSMSMRYKSKFIYAPKVHEGKIKMRTKMEKQLSEDMVNNLVSNLDPGDYERFKNLARVAAQVAIKPPAVFRGKAEHGEIFNCAYCFIHGTTPFNIVHRESCIWRQLGEVMGLGK